MTYKELDDFVARAATLRPGVILEKPASASEEEWSEIKASLPGLIERHNARSKRDAVTKKSLLEAAIQTVADRGVPYGGVEDNFNRIAELWSVHTVNRYGTGLKFDAADVAMMMALMKIARLEANPSHADSWVDVAGYAACGGEIGAKLTLDKSE